MLDFIQESPPVTSAVPMAGVEMTDDPGCLPVLFDRDPLNLDRLGKGLDIEFVRGDTIGSGIVKSDAG